MKQYIPRWMQIFLIWIDDNRILAFVGALVAIMISFIAVFPTYWPIDIPVPLGDVVVYQPLYFIPGRDYTIVVRAKDENTSFSLAEGSNNVYILREEAFEGATMRVRYWLHISASPSLFSRQNAELVVIVNGAIYRDPIPIYAFVLVLRTVLGLIVSTPAVKILYELFFARLKLFQMQAGATDKNRA